MLRRCGMWAGLVLCAVNAFAELPAATPSGDQQSIEVHGHWLIEIYNPDGSLDRVVEFENALVVDGGIMLAMLLDRGRTFGGWAMELQASEGFYNLCEDVGTGDREPCVLCENGVTWPDETHGTNVTVTRNSGQLTISGSLIPTITGDIWRVSTLVKGCLETISPTACKTDGTATTTATVFTSHTFGVGEVVQAGQQVQVTVTLTFS